MLVGGGEPFSPGGGMVCRGRNALLWIDKDKTRFRWYEVEIKA